MRVILIEDSSLYRQNLSVLLMNNPLIKHYHEFSDVESALEWLVKYPRPDLVIMDIDLPGISGIEGVKRIRESGIETAVIMLTVFDDESSLFESLRAGATGYLIKNQSENLLSGSLDSIISGSLVVSPSMSAHILKYFRRPTLRNYRLTGREKEILQLLAQGLSKEQIASTLNISYHTVDSHIKNIFRKMQVQSSVQAVVKALRDRLI